MTPKSSERHEIYLVPTVTVPPTDFVRPPTRSITEGSLRLTSFEAEEANLSKGLQVVPDGEFSENVTVAEKQIAALETADTNRYRAYVEVVEGGATQAAVGSRTGRWTWARAATPNAVKERLIECGWWLHNNIPNMHSVTGLNDFKPYKSSAPAVVVGQDGLLRIFVIGHTADTPKQVRLGCFTYDQRDGYDSLVDPSQNAPVGLIEWDSYSDSFATYGLPYQNGNTPTYDSAASVNESVYSDTTEDRSPQIAACVADGTIIIAVAEWGSSLATGVTNRPGRVHLFSYTEEVNGDSETAITTRTPRFRLLKVDALGLETRMPKARCDGGIALTFTGGRLVMAVAIMQKSAYDETLASRSVIVAAAEDYTSWSVSNDPATVYAAIGGITNTGITVSGNGVITDVSRSGSFIAACVSTGGVLVSSDSGQTWAAMSTPASALSYFPFTLYSICVLSSEAMSQSVIFAGGTGGFLMRSVDSGVTWKILSIPANWQFQALTSVATPLTGASGQVTTTAQYGFQLGPSGTDPRSLAGLEAAAFDVDENNLFPSPFLSPIAGNEAGITSDITSITGIMVSYSDTSTPADVTEPVQSAVRPLVWVSDARHIVVIDQVNNPNAPLVRGGATTDIRLIWKPAWTQSFAETPDVKDVQDCYIADMECLDRYRGVAVAQEKLSTVSLLVVGRFINCEIINNGYAQPYWTTTKYLKTPKALRIGDATSTYAASPYSHQGKKFFATCAAKYLATDQADVMSEQEEFRRIDVIVPSETGSNDFTAYLAGQKGTIGIWRANQQNLFGSGTNQDGVIVPKTVPVRPGFFNAKTASLLPAVRDVIEIVHKVDGEIQDIDHTVDTSGDVDSLWLIVKQRSGIQVWRSDKAMNTDGSLGKTWAGLVLDRHDPALFVAVGTDGALVAGQVAGKEVWIKYLSYATRALPAFITTSRGHTLLATDNLTDGWVEVWKLRRFEGYAPVFECVNADERIQSAKTPRNLYKQDILSFSTPRSNIVTPLMGLDYSAGQIPRATFIEADEGLIILYIWNRAVVASLDDTESWRSAIASEYPFVIRGISGLSGVSFTAEEIERYRRTLVTFAYGGMRLWALGNIMSGGKPAVTVFTCRNWIEVARPFTPRSTQVFPPMLQTRQALGVGDIGVRWVGTPPPRDRYLTVIKSPYPISNLVKESPSYYWRTGTIVSPTDMISAIHGTTKLRDLYIKMSWDRQDSNVQEILGPGTHWNANACGLFGINFPYATWAISAPDYNTDSVPWNNPDVTTQFAMNSVLDKGVTVPKAVFFGTNDGGNATFAARMVDTGKQWPTNYFASGLQEYFVMVITNLPETPSGLMSASNIQIRRIIANTSDTLMLDGPPIWDAMPATDAVYDAPCEYIIFGDRMISDGSMGRRGTLYDRPMPNIAGTDYEFGRFLMLQIGPIAYTPLTKATLDAETASGYLRIGTALFGRSVPVIVPTVDGRQTRHKFNKGWRWNVNTPVINEQFSNNLSMVRRIGKPKQSFTLEYEYVENWEMDVFYGLLFPDTQRAFAVQFAEGDLRSLYLVRINEDVQATHQGGGLFSHGVTLDEVK